MKLFDKNPPPSVWYQNKRRGFYRCFSSLWRWQFARNVSWKLDFWSYEHCHSAKKKRKRRVLVQLLPIKNALEIDRTLSSRASALRDNWQHMFLQQIVHFYCNQGPSWWKIIICVNTHLLRISWRTLAVNFENRQNDAAVANRAL